MGMSQTGKIGVALHEAGAVNQLAAIEVPEPPNVPVMLSALRPGSFRLAGEISDGALAWICPLPYLRDQAKAALYEGAAAAGRPAPPLVGHCFVVVHEDREAVRAEGRA